MNLTPFYKDLANFSGISDDVIKKLTFKNISKSIFVAIVVVIGIKLLFNIISRLIDRSKKIDLTLGNFIKTILKLVLYFIGITIIISSLGFNTTSILAIFSVFGLAVSLSVQNTMQNLASGISIIINKPFVVGDLISISGDTFKVEDVKFMYTKLMNNKNDIIYYPNSMVTSSVVTNFSEDKDRRVDVNIGVDAGIEIEKVKDLLFEKIKSLKNVEPDQPIIIELSSLKDNIATYDIFCFCENELYGTTKYELNTIIKNTFDANNIKLSFII